MLEIYSASSLSDFDFYTVWCAGVVSIEKHKTIDFGWSVYNLTKVDKAG